MDWQWLAFGMSGRDPLTIMIRLLIASLILTAILSVIWYGLGYLIKEYDKRSTRRLDEKYKKIEVIKIEDKFTGTWRTEVCIALLFDFPTIVALPLYHFFNLRFIKYKEATGKIVNILVLDFIGVYSSELLLTVKIDNKFTHFTKDSLEVLSRPVSYSTFKSRRCFDIDEDFITTLCTAKEVAFRITSDGTYYDCYTTIDREELLSLCL